MPQAITGSDRYDDQLRAAAAAGVRDPRELFFELALDDVGRAADLLRSTYDASDRRDGFVSFECTPELADDSAATIEQAVELWNRLARPNVMIKVPATEAGIPAIEELTARGINVNVTLLFSVARYEQGDRRLYRRSRATRGSRTAARRHRFGGLVLRLTRRRQADPRLPADSNLRDRVAIANAQLAYKRYRDRFSNERWPALRDAGARPQRPLWASTDTKDPTYSDVLYVEDLIAPAVVNTMPDSTLRAFGEHGDPCRRFDESAAWAEQTLRRAAAAGIDLATITADLEREGVRSFCASYRALLDRIESRGCSPSGRTGCACTDAGSAVPPGRGESLRQPSRAKSMKM